MKNHGNQSAKTQVRLMTNKKVLIGCEFSGIVRDAFIAEGHDAISCDLLPTERVGPHYQGDVRDLFSEHWDLAIFHPPCTRLCNSGVRWLHERNLWDELEEGAQFFLDCLNAPIMQIAVENPIMHKHAKAIIKKDYTQKVQPWQFGDKLSKQTCFWLKNLPLLKSTDIVPRNKREQKVWLASPSPTRWKARSRFPPGMANAMAIQWGKANS